MMNGWLSESLGNFAQYFGSNQYDQQTKDQGQLGVYLVKHGQCGVRKFRVKLILFIQTTFKTLIFVGKLNLPENAFQPSLPAE